MSSSVGVGNGEANGLEGEEGVTKSVFVGVVAVATPDGVLDDEAFGVEVEFDVEAGVAAVAETVAEAVVESAGETTFEAVSEPVVEPTSVSL